MRSVRRQHGFTLVEMLIIAPIVILVIGAFLTAIIGMTGEVIASRASNALSYNVQDALNRIEQDVKQSSGFLATTTLPVAPPALLDSVQGYNDDITNFTNIGGTSGTSIILNMVATTGSPLSTTSGYVFLKNKPNPCATSQSNIPLTYTVVYFIKDSTLWRRTIMPDAYADTANTVCVTPYQQPSCSPTYMDATATPPFCKTNDIKLVEGLATSDFLVQYYSGEGATTVNTAASTGTAGTRANALQSTTTVSVSLDAKQVAAGRDIERTATLRVSRLDTNASSVANLTVDGVPAAPVPVMKTVPGASASVSWPAVTGATGYTLEYNINGGAWQTVFANQTTGVGRLGTVITATANEDIITVRVTALNGTIPSSYGTASVTLPLWETLLLQNSWINYNPGYTSAQYTKTKTGIVLVKGLVHRSNTGNAVSGELIGTLPVGYRPDAAGSLLFGTLSSDTASRVDVSSSGAITIVVGTAEWFSLDTIAFVPAGTYTRTAMGPYLNGFTNYDPVGWAPGSYVVDSVGRVNLQGLVRIGGTNNNGARITDLPAALLTSEYMHVPSRTDGFGYFGIEYRPGLSAVLAKATGTSYLALNAMYYPASTPSPVTWKDMGLVNGWNWYGSIFSKPQYTKSGADNIVTLKGLIQNPSAVSNNVIAVLDPGYRPKERIVRLVTAADTVARLDIYANGEIHAVNGSNIWFSLDGINFKAE